ncbi:MAG: L,D-transpeptidase family protein [Bacteroidota bacterium]
MKPKTRHHKTTAVLFFCLAFFNVIAQVTPESLRRFIGDGENLSNAGIKNSLLLKKFYENYGFGCAWMGNENAKNLSDLSEMVNHSAMVGLDATVYQPGYFSHSPGNIALQNAEDSIQAELRYTDIALQFIKDFMFGNTQPALGFNGLNYSPDYNNIPVLLASYLSAHTLSSLTSQEEKKLPEIAAIEKKLQWLQTIISDSNFTEVNIGSATVNGKNKELLTKLYQLGMFDTLFEETTDSAIKQKVRQAQRQFNLLDDGTLRPTSLEEFNIPLRIRLQQLTLSVNYYRWLYWLTRNQSVVVVNIPAAAMKVYNDTDVILEMRMVVGKPSTPTPTLASRINEVVLYPYWNVPYSIATRELLPSIKKIQDLLPQANSRF